MIDDTIYNFSTQDALKYGVNEAIILYNIRFWLKKNKANNSHVFKNRYWTYNSNIAFSKLFPFFNTRQVNYAIEKLIKSGILLKDNFNHSAYDRTSWYSINEDFFIVNCNLQNCEMEKTKLSNDILQNCEMYITDINPDINPNLKQKDKKNSNPPPSNSLQSSSFENNFEEKDHFVDIDKKEGDNLPPPLNSSEKLTSSTSAKNAQVPTPYTEKSNNSKNTDEAFKKISNLYYEKETCRQDDYEIYQKTTRKGISVSKFEKEVYCYITARNNEQKAQKREILNNSNLTEEQKKSKIDKIFIPNKLNFKTFCNSLKKDIEIYKDKFEETEKRLKPVEKQEIKKSPFQAMYDVFLENTDFFTDKKTQQEIDVILKFKDKIRVELDYQITKATDSRSGYGYTKTSSDVIVLNNLKLFQEEFFKFLKST